MVRNDLRWARGPGRQRANPLAGSVGQLQTRCRWSKD